MHPLHFYPRFTRLLDGMHFLSCALQSEPCQGWWRGVSSYHKFYPTSEASIFFPLHIYIYLQGAQSNTLEFWKNWVIHSVLEGSTPALSLWWYIGCFIGGCHICAAPLSWWNTTLTWHGILRCILCGAPWISSEYGILPDSCLRRACIRLVYFLGRRCLQNSLLPCLSSDLDRS